MNINTFKNQNKLQEANIDVLRTKIETEVKKDYQIKENLKLKEKAYKENSIKRLREFFTMELNFILTEKDKNLIFEFKNEQKNYKIVFTDNKYGMFITHNFTNESKEIKIYINLKDIELNNLEWSLEEEDFFLSGGRNLKYKYVEQNSSAWYEEEYNNIKRLVEENVQTMDKVNGREIKDLFVITACEDEEKEYNNIIELIKEIIENN